MSRLVSGKEALIALANGEEVQIREPSGDKWYDPRLWTVGELLRWNGEFRLKPRTVYLNGIEVPKPQKDSPKKGDDVFILDFTNNVGGFTSWKCQNSINTLSCEWWRSEEEIKQVVAALREVFK